MGNNYTMVAKTLFGFEEILARELQQLGALDIETGNRMVSFMGDEGFMYKANLACRTAIKILKPIHRFPLKNEQELYEGIYRMNWPTWLHSGRTFAIDATVFSDHFNHSKFIALRSKDAIADHFRDKTGSRPSVDTLSPDLRINVHIHQSECTVSLDSSGSSLHQRGYKTDTNIAPINEVLAAGLLLMAGWDGQCNFLDPMCGSGTILAEAAMIAANIPVNLHRSEFAFQRWAAYDAALFETIRKSLIARQRPFTHHIQGYDTDFTAIKKAKINIHSAGLAGMVDVTQQNFFTSMRRNSEPLFILFNPPYDERIGINTREFYEEIGNTLKRQYPNTTAWFITANHEALKSVGLKPSQKIKVFNGALEARLVRYDMWEGKKSDMRFEI